MGSSFEEILSLAYCDNGIVLAGTGSNTGDAYIYKSIDYGQTWTQIDFDTYSSFQTVEALCYLGNGIVLGGGGNTTLRGRSLDLMLDSHRGLLLRVFITNIKLVILGLGVLNQQ